MISINFEKNGIIILNDLDLDENIPLSQQVDLLKEDMLQVEFPLNYILDVSWRPSFQVDGKFYIVIIKDFDWDEPLFSATADNINQLIEKIYLAMELIP
ncbi:hypothetical protein ACRU1U_19795 [Providencia stuartii]|uniref:hypothetical protein n=2 Tax=Providencia stuartii TaxID=588 RepID=UPI0004F7B67E|nr:hypothetical protein [Providencia stuartii]AIN65473.1 hypothetical protein DR96_2001 [Providencia stuartii]SPY69275.1 Uncharacterised protein [Providencia stuartii]SUC78119.1 Uncharacterised protein [Providencia stuartii]